jgi:hypothetical protein
MVEILDHLSSNKKQKTKKQKTKKKKDELYDSTRAEDQ